MTIGRRTSDPATAASASAHRGLPSAPAPGRPVPLGDDSTGRVKSRDGRTAFRRLPDGPDGNGGRATGKGRSDVRGDVYRSPDPFFRGCSFSVRKKRFREFGITGEQSLSVCSMVTILLSIRISTPESTRFGRDSID